MPPSASGFDPVQVIAARVREAIVRAFPGRDEAGTADPMITPGRNPALGDFQSNAAMALGKALGLPPRQVAQAIIANLDPGELLEPLSEASAAGPGFINFRLRSPALGVLLDRLESARLGLEPPSEPRTVVVDLCGVNLAKQMHVGHLRSTIIGDALARTLERLGHRVVRQNHVGDWGLPIAMVTAKLRDQAAAGAVDPDRLTLDGLESLYRRAQLECAADERGLAAARRSGHPKALAELEAQVEGATGELARAKATLLRLQAHDPETVAWWRRVYDITMAACLATVRRLHADIDEQDSAGESSYAHELAPLADDLRARGIAEESDGALVVRVEGLAEPCLVRKSDGGYLYATTDLAAIRRRVWTLGAERVIYCVDARQALHFKQVFAAARRAGYAT
ncbi:MAG TPA: arginine--tRNA ligase, partial [Phycisphaerales bacterium]|nr:arginine--tRNA ligase [Phycisphaerales bacterium]